MNKKIYLVGGAVRDELMGLEPKDKDYVCVGYTHEDMITMGFEQVGSAFPVYLEPVTKEEYALARTERSTGAGYHDFEVVFSPDVTIEEDLKRRDLTINAIAKDLETGEYIDPFNGAKDIERKVLRHVSRDTLRDDPLRIYRLARLFARYGGTFQVAPSTVLLAHQAKENLAALPKERKMAEIRKCFEDQSSLNKPSIMVDTLCKLGEMPEVNNLKGVKQPEAHHPEGDAYVHTLLCLDYAQGLKSSPEVKWAVLCHDLGKVMYWEHGHLRGHEFEGLGYVQTLGERFGVPNKWMDLAWRVCDDHTRLHRVFDMRPKKVYDLISRLKGEKDQEFILKFVEACICDARGRGPTKINDDYDQPTILLGALAELVRNRKQISEESKAIALEFKGRPDIIHQKVKNLKVGYVAKGLSKVKSEVAERNLHKSVEFTYTPKWVNEE
ncbi:putative tRNA nucleotidyltransferase [Salmonella phage SSBI34]|nr:putative tRNA nucleotidyltransferase [Salmonella phage SSBI34]